MPALSETEQRVAVTLARLLAEGEAVPQSRVSETLELDPAEVAAAVTRLRTALTDAEGRVVACCGLTVRETPHRFRVGESDLYVFCAWDALLLPGILGRSARVESSCAETGRAVTVELTRSGAPQAEPAGAVLSFAPPPPAGVDFVEAFCRRVNFFASPEAGQRWISRYDDLLVLSLADGHRLGEAVNRACFSALLGPDGLPEA